METNRRTAAFSSRAFRRADRMANAQIERAETSACVVDQQDVATVQSTRTNTVDPKDTQPERIIHEHLLRMSINVPVKDKRQKYTFLLSLEHQPQPPLPPGTSPVSQW